MTTNTKSNKSGENIMFITTNTTTNMTTNIIVVNQHSYNNKYKLNGKMVNPNGKW